MSLYRYRFAAYAALVFVLVAAGLYQSTFTWEIIGPPIVLYLPASLTVFASFRLFGSNTPAQSQSHRRFGVARCCRPVLLAGGGLLLASYAFPQAGYAPMAGMWMLLISLELYLAGAEATARETRRAALVRKVSDPDDLK
jgi:hypothetical protein